jgi:hypothetical protein
LNIFCEAIRERRLVRFTYHGWPRVIVTAAHGAHVTTGNAVVRGYQVDGQSSSRKTPFWSLFRVHEMEQVALLDDLFEDDPAGFVKGDSDIVVHCEL